MYGYDDDEDDYRSTGRTIGLIVGVVAVALVGWFVVRPRLGDGGDSVTPALVDPIPTTTSQPLSESASFTATTEAAATPAVATTASATTDGPPSTADTSGATTGATAAADTNGTAAPPDEAPPYETLPDGTPVPVLVLYDVSKITLTGAVPDQAASDRLQFLAIANAKPGQDSVENFLTINPAVPRHVGVRVLELTSVRFPEGSSDVLPAHALELDRIVSIMNALPRVTVLVVGHADQRGSDLANYEISKERADAVVDYLADHGIDPSRLSSRAVGATDLLTLNNEPAAFALNRRTEFVFYGLLLE
jgi:outer membrane protein OmpA-like peptidoglycan-associated protein